MASLELRVNWEELQLALFDDRFIAILAWIKNYLVVVNEHEFVSQSSYDLIWLLTVWTVVALNELDVE